MCHESMMSSIADSAWAYQVSPSEVFLNASWIAITIVLTRSSSASGSGFGTQNPLPNGATNYDSYLNSRVSESAELTMLQVHELASHLELVIILSVGMH